MSGRPAHDHCCDDFDCATLFNLYKHIDLARVACLNEDSEGSCTRVFKPWGDRLDFSGEPLRSCDGDPELLLHIPFLGEVKVRAISIIGGSPETAPAKARLYTNRDDLDFGTVQDLQPLQTFDLNHDPRGILEYPVNAARFNGVHSLDIHFPESLGSEDCTEIYFVGIKGEFYERKREAVEAVYELKPMADATKMPGTEGNTWSMGM